MDSSQIIKCRLVQLKKMSVELKQTTQNTNQVDFNLISSILSATKLSTSKVTKNGSSVSYSTVKQNQQQSPLNKLLKMSTPNQQKYNKSLFPQHNYQNQNSKKIINKNDKNLIHLKYFQHDNDEWITAENKNNQINIKLEQHNNRFNKTQTFNRNYHQSNTKKYNNYENNINIDNNSSPQNQQYINSLREQNQRLQQALQQLKSQIQQLKLKQIRIKQQDQIKQGLPYFKFNQKIQAFYTRLNINQNDYMKIDYMDYQLDLALDKLVIRKLLGNTQQKQLSLEELVQVQYIQSNIMLLHFQSLAYLSKKIDTNNSENHPDNDTQTFFIKFKNQQELHRWDLALFINFKIVEALKKDKLFISDKRNRRNSSSNQSKFQQRFKQTQNDLLKKTNLSDQNMKDQDQKLMKKLIQQRNQYLETKKLVSQKMVQKIQQKKSLTTSDNKKQNIYDDVDQYSQTQNFQIKDESIANKNLFTTLNKQKKSQSQYAILQRNNTSKFIDIHHHNKIINNNSAVLVHNQLGLSFNPNEYQLSISRKLQEQKLKQKQQQKQNQQIQMKNKKIQQIIKKMTNQGYQLTKYSKDGFNPHDKRIFISSDLTKFCWEQDNGKDLKQIPFSTIKQVQYQKIGQGIRKHIKKPKKGEHCIISYEKDKKIKVIQLGANATLMAQFYDELQILIQFIRENYASNKVISE